MGIEGVGGGGGDYRNYDSILVDVVYSGTSFNGPSEKRTTSISRVHGQAACYGFCLM